jgi:hypothetical protein
MASFLITHPPFKVEQPPWSIALPAELLASRRAATNPALSHAGVSAAKAILLRSSCVTAMSLRVEGADSGKEGSLELKGPGAEKPP